MLDLRKKGFENAVALLGGMDAWKNAGLPVDKRQSRPAFSIWHFPFLIVISGFNFEVQQLIAARSTEPER